jgi:hypothetical protein
MNKTKLFASLDANNVVENYSTINYSHRVIEYCDCEELCTRNAPIIGAIFDEELNAFIYPKESWMDDTWTFNLDTSEWEPDPDVIYYHIDNIPHQWNPETREWYQVTE